MPDPSDRQGPPALGQESTDPHQDLAGVLHDVSNALTVLLGWVGEARAPEATPEAVGYALTIIEQRARIARDLARHAIGSPRLDLQRDVGSIVDEVAKSLRVEAQKRGVALAVRAAQGSALVAGTIDLSQVLTNLVLNALAYATTGGAVELSVSVDEETCVVVVSDDGPGVAPERHEKIFRGDSLRPGGVGVGLRHSRALARAAGGDVELSPHDGRGARFRIAWPRADRLPRPPVSAARIADLVGARILVVEDDAAVTQLLDAALGARGAVLAVASTQAELDKALEGRPYDAALVDLSPIAGDASGALARLRAHSPAASVILITGSADALTEEIAAESVELVRKPFEVREVVAALSRRR